MRTVYSIMMSVTTIMLKSFLLKSIWVWFIVPQFLIQPLKLSTAIGIVLLSGGINNWKTASKSELAEIKSYDEKDAFIVPFTNFLAHTTDIIMIYVFAWLIHCMT